MPNARRLPSGSWRCQASANGQRMSFTADTKKEAEWLAAEWKMNQEGRQRPSNKTVGDKITEYIASRSNILSPATIAGYKKIDRLYFGGLKKIKVSELTALDVQREINQMAGNLSPKTIHNAYGLLKAATETDFRITLPQKQKPTYRTPSVRQIQGILAVTAGTAIEVPVLLALWCGLRMSEVRGLRWDRVYPDRIIIDTAIVDVDGVPTVKAPKTTESKRTIEIPPSLYGRIQMEPHTTDYVVNLSGHAIYQRFQKLTGNVCRFHDLRHANASIMMMLGVPDVYAMERGGWETESIYKKTYVQTMDERRTEANRAIDSFFEEIIAHENAHEERKSLLN